MTVGDGYFRLEKSPPQPLPLNPRALPDGLEGAYRYSALRTTANRELWGGWKLGGTNRASRQAFGVEHLYYGAIRKDEILQNARYGPGFHLCELQGEVELALRIAGDGETFDAWAVALEMPAAGITGLPQAGVAALVSDRCAAGALLLGPTQTGPLPEGASQVAQRIDGQKCAETSVSSLCAAPQEIFHDFITLARKHGAPIAPGHWVATGGITPCLSYDIGQQVVVTLDDVVVIDCIIGTEDLCAAVG